MKREKEHMSWDMFVRTMEMVTYFESQGTQPELSLTGVGEALLNPLFIKMVKYARSVYKGHILFSTNGILLTEDVVKVLAELDIRVYVSLHRPEVATPAINLARKYNILNDINYQFTTSSFNWAGQVDWKVTAQNINCDYLMNGWGVVLQDGTITTCCMDAEGFNKVGIVGDLISDLGLEPKELCDSCHMVPPVSVVTTLEEAS